HVANLKGKKRSSSGRIRDPFEHLVTRSFGAADVRADGVDDCFGALRHFDRFLASYVALIVLAVAQQNNGPPRRPALRFFQELIPAGIVERVVKRGSATRPQLSDSVRQLLRIVGKILSYFRRHVET